MRPTLPTQGVWINDAGNLELNQGYAARPIVSLESAPGGGRHIAAYDRNALTLGETVRGTLDVQRGVGGHAAIPGEGGSVVVPHKGPLTRPEVMQVVRIGQQHGLSNVVDRGNGVIMTNFQTAPNAVATAQALRQPGGLATQIATTLPGRPMRAAVDSVYVPLGDLWRQGEGSAAVTDHLLAMMARYPEHAAQLDASELIPQVARNKYARCRKRRHRQAPPGRAELARDSRPRARLVEASQRRSGVWGFASESGAAGGCDPVPGLSRRR